MELAEYYGGMHNPMYGRPHQMAHILPYGGAFSGGAPSGGASLALTNPEYFACAKTDWKNRKANCAQFRKPARERRPRQFAKGSDEMRAYMAQLRAMRKPAGTPRAPKKARVSRACAISGTKYSLGQLRAAAKEAGIRGFSKMRKADLCATLSQLTRF
jgi:hypothetical protein